MSSMVGSGEARLAWKQEALARQEQREKARQDQELRLLGLKDFDYEQMAIQPEEDTDLCPHCRKPLSE